MKTVIVPEVTEVINEQLKQLIYFIDGDNKPLPMLGPDDLTRKVYAEYNHISEKAAGNKLEALVKKGVLIQVYKRDSNGNKVVTYQKAPG